MTTNAAVVALAERLRNAVPEPGTWINLMNRRTMHYAYGRVERVIVKRRGGARGFANTGMVLLSGFLETAEPVSDPSEYFDYVD
jgi:hypothetical protein